MGQLWELVESYLLRQPFRISERQLAQKLGYSSSSSFDNWREPKSLPSPQALVRFAALSGTPYQRVLDAALTDTGFLPEPPVEEGPLRHGTAVYGPPTPLVRIVLRPELADAWNRTAIREHLETDLAHQFLEDVEVKVLLRGKIADPDITLHGDDGRELGRVEVKGKGGVDDDELVAYLEHFFDLDVERVALRRVSGVRPAVRRGVDRSVSELRMTRRRDALPPEERSAARSSGWSPGKASAAASEQLGTESQD